MKMITHLLAITLTVGILTFYQPIQAELLVMKQTEAGFAALDDSDNVNKPIIEQILFTYQWPTSAAFALKPIDERRKILDETGDLFKPDRPNAEEIWIEQKIQQETRNNTYRVVFFPTSLYELRVMLEMLTIDDHNPDRHWLDSPPPTKLVKIIRAYTVKEPTIDLIRLLNDNTSKPAKIRKDILDKYMNANTFPTKGAYNVYSYVNQIIVNWLLVQYPELKASKDSAALSDGIQVKSADLIENLIATILLRSEFDRATSSQHLPKAISKMKFESQNKIITNYIALEYEARKLNKALLVRGTSVIPFKTAADEISSIPSSENRPLVGTTLTSKESAFSSEQAYKRKRNIPYSVAFGNSLFAGCYNDYTACAYAFLSGSRVSILRDYAKQTGYVLFIDKYNYIENNNGQLFFIPPLSTLAALVQSGEFFHARAKAAIAIKNSVTGHMVQGIETDDTALKDPAGILLITRDPFKHAALFAEFLVNNGRIIQKGDLSQLTAVEKQFAENVMRMQKEAARYYEAIPTLTPAVQKFEKRFLERKAAKTATQGSSSTTAPAKTSVFIEDKE